MRISLTGAISLFFLTFVSVIFINIVDFQMQIAKTNDFHYGIVHELENSDFDRKLITELQGNKQYTVSIEAKGAGDHHRIYEVKTKKAITLPLFRYEQEYVKESVAR